MLLSKKKNSSFMFFKTKQNIPTKRKIIKVTHIYIFLRSQRIYYKDSAQEMPEKNKQAS
jgi:hypothetical protein